MTNIETQLQLENGENHFEFGIKICLFLSDTLQWNALILTIQCTHVGIIIYHKNIKNNK